MKHHKKKNKLKMKTLQHKKQIIPVQDFILDISKMITQVKQKMKVKVIQQIFIIGYFI